MSDLMTNELPATDLRTADFDYDLPQDLIAQHPTERRDASRLMVLDRKQHTIEHRHFSDLTDYLRPGDVLVVNDSKVIPARLYGHVKDRPEAAIELLLLRQRELDLWEVLVKPGKRARIGMQLVFGDGMLTGEVTDIVEEGNRLIRFDYDRAEHANIYDILHRIGLMPLPPYITEQLKDNDRYQTVLRARGRLGSGADSWAALYAGAARPRARNGRCGRAGNAPCGTGDLPPGEGRQHPRPHHAHGVLLGQRGKRKNHQRAQARRRAADLRGNHLLPDD